jgi:ABC-type multidrug transport system ATPase subunit
LDDPLSALDQQVARRVFDECVKGYLSDRAVVIVTHQLQYLPFCDYVAILNDGGIKELGTFDELLKQPGRIASFCIQLNEFAGKMGQCER